MVVLHVDSWETPTLVDIEGLVYHCIQGLHIGKWDHSRREKLKTFPNIIVHIILKTKSNLAGWIMPIYPLFFLSKYLVCKPSEASPDGEAFPPLLRVWITSWAHPLEATCTRGSVDLSKLMGLQDIHLSRELVGTRTLNTPRH